MWFRQALSSFPEVALSQYGRLSNDSKESKPQTGRWFPLGYSPPVRWWHSGLGHPVLVKRGICSNFRAIKSHGWNEKRL